MKSKNLTTQDLKDKLHNTCRYLEYDQEEIHSVLYAPLEQKNILPYESNLVSYDRVHPPKDYDYNKSDAMKPYLKQFTPWRKREVDPLIFHYKEKVFVNVYPTPLPQIINGFKYSDFEYKFKDAIFELENFLYENQNLYYREIIFNIPTYKENLHWVEATIKIDTKKMVIAYVNDPFDKPGISDNSFQEIRKIVRYTLEFQSIACLGKIQNFSFKEDHLPNIQRDLYCGGATRRMRDATIFSPDNNPYNWEDIDYEPSKIQSNYKDSLDARVADLKLLLNSKKKRIKEVGQTLLKRYEMITFALQKNAEKIKPLAELFNKFINIDEEVWMSYSTLAIKDVELAIIKLVSEEFEARFTNSEHKNEKEKRKLKNDWVHFCIIQEKPADIDRFPKEFLLKKVVVSEKTPSYYLSIEERNQEVNDLVPSPLKGSTRELSFPMKNNEEGKKITKSVLALCFSKKSFTANAILSEFAIYIGDDFTNSTATELINDLDIYNIAVLNNQLTPILYEKIDFLKEYIDFLQKNECNKENIDEMLQEKKFNDLKINFYILWVIATKGGRSFIDKINDILEKLQKRTLLADLKKDLETIKKEYKFLKDQPVSNEIKSALNEGGNYLIISFDKLKPKYEQNKSSKNPKRRVTKVSLNIEEIKNDRICLQNFTNWNHLHY